MATIDIKLKSYDELIFEITKLNTDKYLLQQENKQLKEKLENYKQENKELKVNKNLNHVQKKEFEKLIHTNNRLIHCDEILTELEEWLKEEMKKYDRDIYLTLKETLDKIQELKEKYK